MEVNRLLGDEITHELLIRGLPTSGTVATKRSLLRDALRLERTGESAPPLCVNVDTLSELTTCQDKLSDLEEDIRNFKKENAQNEFKRISSRLMHISLRLERLICEDSSSPKLGALLGWCNDLTNMLKGRNQSIMDEPTPHQLNKSLIDEPLLLFPETIDPSEIRHNSQIRNGASAQIEAEMALLNIGNEQRSTTQNQNVPSISETLNCRPDSPVDNMENVYHHYLKSPDMRNNPRSSSIRFKEPIDELSKTENPIVYNSKPLESHHIPITGRSLVDRTYQGPTKTLEYVNFGMSNNNPIKKKYYEPSPAESSVNRITNFYSEERCDIHRWGLKYDGQTSLSNFLERLEELRHSRGISKTRLLQSAVELFEKDALLWYRMNEFTSWDDLLKKLRDAFQPYDYENALWDEIRRRTQGTGERVISYVSVMENLFRKLQNRPTENERVTIVRRNMLPYIQTQMSLHQLNTIEDLIRTARMIEETEMRIQKFCPPPTSGKHLVEPELAYKKQSGYGSHAAPVCLQAKNNCESDIAEKNKPFCWNCGDSTHKFRKCNKPKKLFCFKCGRPDVTSTKCPECVKNAKVRQ